MTAKRRAATLSFLASLLLAAGTGSPALAGVRLELEGGLTFQTRNEFAVPGTDGTRLDLADFDQGPFAAGRATLTIDLGERTALRLLAAPLSLSTDFQPTQDVRFQNVVFPARSALTAGYKFNSYRVTVWRRFGGDGPWEWRLGLTAKLRDAEISLDGAGQRSVKSNLGFVPLIYGGVTWRAAERLSLDLTFDALAAPQGRAEDVAVTAGLRLSPRLQAKLGYRLLEGGADNDEVYTFACFHSAIVAFEIGF
jgi:hypothetical protein